MYFIVCNLENNIMTYQFIETDNIAGAGMNVTFYKQTLSEFGFGQSLMFYTGTLRITIVANIGDVVNLLYYCCISDSVVGFIHGENALTNINMRLMQCWNIYPANVQSLNF